MPDLLAARSQMAVSLAFHVVFAVIGIAMPLMMVLAERRWQVTGHAIYLDLAKRWAKGTAILFAVGAVSGTVLSFELGLLWPRFMEFAGPIIGMPFSLEGFAFFTEAIFLGIYLYGWDRISARAHLWAGVAVAVSGTASGVFVVIANAWMNAPTGFELVNGQAVNVDPIAAMANAAAVSQTLHMTLAAYAATGFAVAGIHAFRPSTTPRRGSGGWTGCHGPVGRPSRRFMFVLDSWSRSAGISGSGGCGPMACLAARGPSTQSLAPAGSRARHADGLRGRRGGVDGHRAGPPAVGDLRRLEDPGRRHADAGVGRAVCHLHSALLLPRRDCRLAPVPTHHPQSGGAGVARVLHATREQHVTLAGILAGIVFVALNAYAVLGGADFGGGVWDLLALGPRRERQRELIAEAIGPGWEANHVWLILAIVLLFTCFPPAFARLGT